MCKRGCAPFRKRGLISKLRLLPSTLGAVHKVRHQYFRYFLHPLTHVNTHFYTYPSSLFPHFLTPPTQKVLTYFMNSPLLLLLPMKAYFKISMTTARQGTAPSHNGAKYFKKILF